jgi:hypothetical protein
MLPKLREVVGKVLAKGEMSQAQLAKRLYGTEAKQGKVSKMLKAGDKDGWEIHWQACARLVPIAIALGILTERDLMDVKSHEPKHHGSATTGGTKAGTR